MLTMESVEPTIGERTSSEDGDQGGDNMLLSSKPLHRFVRSQPRALAIPIVMFGCAEFLMGFHLTSNISLMTSARIYIPYWQGLLFLACGTLSIYTELRPSKKMVTVCLALYVITLLGILVSACYRISHLLRYRDYIWYLPAQWELYRTKQLVGVESVLVSSSLCAFVLLIILCVTARLALKSTRTQVIIRHIPEPKRDTPSN